MTVVQVVVIDRMCAPDGQCWGQPEGRSVVTPNPNPNPKPKPNPIHNPTTNPIPIPNPNLTLSLYS